MHSAQTRTRSRVRTAVAVAGIAAATVGLAAAQSPAGATPSTTLVVNEVFGGGGNSGATLKNDTAEFSGQTSDHDPQVVDIRP